MSQSSLSAKGTSGEVRVAGRQAASFANWTLQPMGGRTYVVSATLKTKDSFWLDKQDVKRQVRLHEPHWRFGEVADLSVSGNTITITLVRQDGEPN